MKNNYSIHVPVPCHENWDAMTPVEQGRFCQSCAKQVVDFSMMTDQEVLNYFSKATGNTCGRFNNDQLQRPLQPTKIEKKKTWWIAAMMPLMLMFEKVGAQKKNIIATRQHKTIVRKPIASVNGELVSLKDGQNIVANSTANVTHINSNDINYVKPNISGDFTTNIYIRLGGYAICRPLLKQDTIPALIHRIYSKQSFNIYPNPALRGSEVTIAFKSEGVYSIQLFDNSGKLVAINNYNASTASLKTTFNIPSSLTTGVYYIRLINAESKKQYTSKLIVK